MSRSPPPDAGDAGGWAWYGQDWRHFYDCMLAPVARQAEGAGKRCWVGWVGRRPCWTHRPRPSPATLPTPHPLPLPPPPFPPYAATLARLDLRPAPPLTAASPGPASGLAAALRALDASLAAVQRASWGEPAVGSAAPPGGGTPVAALLPLHGPTAVTCVSELLRAYGEWTAAATAAATSAGSVAVLYASAYGNTAALAQAVARGVTKAGVGAECVNLETATPEEVDAALERCAGFAVGSPTLGGHMPTQVLAGLGAILRSAATKDRPCGVFGSFGWSGEARDDGGRAEGGLERPGAVPGWQSDSGRPSPLFHSSFMNLLTLFRPWTSWRAACGTRGTALRLTPFASSLPPPPRTCRWPKSRAPTWPRQC